MRRRMNMAAWIGMAAFVGGIPLYAQEHNHPQPTQQQTTQTAPARSGGVGMEQSQSIF